MRGFLFVCQDPQCNWPEVGIYPSQLELKCPACGKIGYGKTMMFRWHFDNCPTKTGKKRGPANNRRRKLQ